MKLSLVKRDSKGRGCTERCFNAEDDESDAKSACICVCDGVNHGRKPGLKEIEAASKKDWNDGAVLP